MGSTLYIQELKNEFGHRKAFETHDLVSFYRRFQADLPRTTVNWRIYELVRRGWMNRIGKGRFSWGNKADFTPSLPQVVYDLNKLLKERFPFADYCTWHTSMITPFHLHIPGNSFTLVDVERDAAESVFYFLKEEQPGRVFYKPSKNGWDTYVTDIEDPVIVRNLVSEAPVRLMDDIPTTTLEKILVDLFCDDEFEYARNGELPFIFENAMERYVVNLSRLTRYANRKGKKQELTEFLNTIKRQ